MPRLFCLLCCLLAALPAAAQGARGADYDVLDYRFALTLSDANDEIRGTADVTVLLGDLSCPPAASGAPVCAPPPPHVWLDLVGQRRDGRGMTVDSVADLMSGPPRLCLVEHRDSSVVVAVQNWRAGEVRRFRVHYRGIPADGLIIAQNKHGRRTFFGDNWPERARHWLPTVDHPGDKATVTWHVTAPRGYGIIANGRRMWSTCDDGACRAEYRSDVPLPTKVMVIGVAPFAVTAAGTAAGVPVESWVYEEDRDAGFREYARAVPIVAYFDSLLAPFPFEKLANVQSKTRYGGMENAGAIFYHENSTPGDGSQEGLLAHEIAHQWFGDHATEADWPHLWLSEGFATYLTELWFERTQGTARLRQGMERQRTQVLAYWQRAPAPLVDTVYSDPNELLNPNPYQRGSWVLHMLRRHLGDADFLEGIRLYLLRHGGRNATTADLQRAFEAASGRDLGGFFAQWTRRAGQPRLEATWHHAGGEVVLTLRQTQPAPAFVFALDVAVGDTLHTVAVDAQTETFRFRTPAHPARVVLDPNVQLLFEDGGVREQR